MTKKMPIKRDKRINLWNESFPFRLAVRTGVYLSFVLFLIILSSYLSVAWLLSKNADTNLLMQAHRIISQWTQAGTIKPYDVDHGFYWVKRSDGHMVIQHGDRSTHSFEDISHANLMGLNSYSFRYRLEQDKASNTGMRAFFYQLFPIQKGFREVLIPFTIGSMSYVMELEIESDDTLKLLRTILGVLGSIAIIGFILKLAVVAFSSREGFRPVRTIIETAKTIEKATLSTRINTHMKDRTLNDLASVLNHMLERLEQAFQVQARFVQDASHELRTPLAVLKSDLEITLRRTRTL